MKKNIEVEVEPVMEQVHGEIKEVVEPVIEQVSRRNWGSCWISHNRTSNVREVERTIEGTNSETKHIGFVCENH